MAEAAKSVVPVGPGHSQSSGRTGSGVRCGRRTAEETGAAEWTRTTDPVLTKDVLYRLSYGSILARVPDSFIFGPGPTGYVASMVEKASERAPRRSPEGERARKERLARLAAAMRENLKRRKAQKRAREEPRSPPEDGR